MGSAEWLRFHDVRDAYRLIGECRDLGNEPVLWQTRLLEGLGQLLGVRAACGGEGAYVGAERQIAVTSTVCVGMDASERKIFNRWFREVGPNQCPIDRALKKLSAPALTRRRAELVPDRQWYRSSSFALRADAPFDHQLVSIVRAAGRPGITVLCSHQERGRPNFSPRQQRLAHFVHTEIAPLIGRSLVSSMEPGPEGLSPRLRQTLVCLLEGDSEKQVAARLQLSRATAHQYVSALYRHFMVQSRGQLLALVLRRVTRRSWAEMLREVGSPGN